MMDSSSIVSFRRSLKNKKQRFLSTIVTLLFLLTTTTVTAQSVISTTQAQWNLAGLGYLSYSGIDGINGSGTQNAVKAFQGDRCLSVDGDVGVQTSAELVAVMKLVQGKVGATPQDGLNGPNTKQKIINYQNSNGLVADGMAGSATFSKMGLVRTKTCPPPSTSTGPVGDVHAPSNGISCASGTRDLGVHDGYTQGTKLSVRLCAIPGFKSSSDESQSSSSFYVASASGDVIVNSRMSGAALALFQAAKKSGLTFTAVSSFRTMVHQQQLCNANSLCRQGVYTFVARPGYSNHQLGVAIDFAGTNVKGGSTCATRATDSSSSTWKWLNAHASDYGFHQYSAESWHWDATAAC